MVLKIVNKLSKCGLLRTATTLCLLSMSTAVVSSNDMLFAKPEPRMEQVENLFGDITFQFINEVDDIVDAAQTTEATDMETGLQTGLLG